jgi:hypothetical protein
MSRWAASSLQDLEAARRFKMVAACTIVMMAFSSRGKIVSLRWQEKPRGECSGTGVPRQGTLG